MIDIVDTIAGVLREHRWVLGAPVPECSCQWTDYDPGKHFDHVAEAVAAAIEPIIQRKAVLAGALASEAISEEKEARIRADECRQIKEELRRMANVEFTSEGFESLRGATIWDVANWADERADQHERITGE